METDGVHYYSRNDEISEKEFKEYKKQIKILTQIVKMNRKVERFYLDKERNFEKEIKKRERKKH